MLSDVWAVTLNGYLETICADRDLAGVAIERIKRKLDAGHRKPGAWAPVGGNEEKADAWTAPNVTSLSRKRWRVEE